MSTTLELQSIHLRVADLARTTAFYVERLGLVVEQQSTNSAALAVAPGAPPILTLTEDRGAAVAPRDAAGLFHAALLLPSRAALGAWLRIVAERGVEFDGFSDHGVSEAIYLRDPENNGLEFYADRPRDAWPFDATGQLAMVTKHLDLDSLLTHSSAVPSTPLAGARWGHLHLRVTNLARSDAFYREAFGMALMQGTYPGARFLAADGYHHHVALNTWGHPRTAQPPGALGLAEATFARAGVTSPQTVRDPDGIGLRLAPR